MCKLLILSTLIAAAVAKPGILGGLATGPIAAAPLAVAVGPTGVSQQSRADIVSPGAYTVAAAAPILGAGPIIAAAAPLASISGAVTSQLDVRQPVVGVSALASPLAVGTIGTGYGVGLGVGGLGVGGLGVGALGVGGLGVGGLAVGGARLGGGLGLVGHGYGK